MNVGENECDPGVSVWLLGAHVSKPYMFLRPHGPLLDASVRLCHLSVSANGVDP